LGFGCRASTASSPARKTARNAGSSKFWRVQFRVAPELASAYISLLYFAANVTGVRVEELRLAHLLGWLQRPCKE